MKWIKIFSYLGLILAIGIGSIFLWVEKRDQTQRNKHNKEQNWKARLEHAHMQTYLKNYFEAEKEYRQLLETDPYSTDVKINLATIFYYQKRYGEAIDLLDSIPTQMQAEKLTLLKANIYLSMNDYPKAEALFINYLNQIPTDQQALLKLAELFSWEKKYHEAIEIYQKILRENPENIQIRREYAKVLIWMNKPQEAAEELEKTLPDEK